jgi:OmcA/MtrC family decaheme c-type cytochrome
MVRKSLLMLGMVSLILPLMFLGCGSDGDTGPQGAQGIQGPAGPGAPQAKAESCSVCHQGEPRGGNAHQAAYDELYQDNVVRVTNLAYAFTDNNDVVTFAMEGPNDVNCETVDNINIYFAPYTGTDFQIADPADERLSIKGTLVDDGAGNCTSTNPSNDNVDLSTQNGIFVVYGRHEKVADNIPNSRVVQYKYPYAAVLETATFAAAPYVSAANAAGCEKCHTVPYLKHGYIYGEVDHDPATDFYTCKACHIDNVDGGHFIWQVLVSDQTLAGDLFASWVAEGRPDKDLEEYMTPAEQTTYAYKRRLMNDVHMSHAMEFAYPQSMSNCATCHEGKLTQLLTAANFTPETCKSCHPVTGPGKSGEQQPPSLQSLWVAKGVEAFHTIGGTCSDTTSCHADGSGRAFSDLHTGYNDLIYADAAGTKFADAITVSIDNATLVGTDLTIGISASGAAGVLDSADITPAVLVGLYGYDTKDFIVNGHDRWDSNCNGTTSRGDGDQPIGEYVVGAEVAGCPNPYWTLVSGGPGAGPWVITAHLATWSGMIDNNVVKRVEIAVLPELENAEEELVGLNAVSRTFVLATGAFDDTFFGHDIVDVGKCNNCHDQLATTFHSGDRGGNITVCRMCHVTLSGGSHLEMQSRSIDSYVHAIHSFQAFDIGDIDFTDPFEALLYEHHIDSHFPTFGTEDCLACHNAGKFNSVDQSKSLPGVLSGSDPDVVFYGGLARNIGDVPSYITGPATRACGACHRAHEINEDNAGELASLFSHWGSFGTLVEAGDPPDDIYTVIEELFSTL